MLAAFVFACRNSRLRFDFRRRRRPTLSRLNRHSSLRIAAESGKLYSITADTTAP